jgi:hypothetical protein
LSKLPQWFDKESTSTVEDACKPRHQEVNKGPKHKTNDIAEKDMVRHGTKKGSLQFHTYLSEKIYVFLPFE